MKRTAFMALTLLAMTALQTPQAHAGKPAISPLPDGNDAHDVGPADAIVQLRKVAADYHQAMVQKDMSALLSIYYDENVPIIGSVASPSFARMTAATNGKAPKLYPSTAKAQSAADTSAQTTAEKMSNLTIHTDGTVASLEYDYEIPQGYGHTCWTLVATQKAWKITSVVYSMNIRVSAK